MITIHMLALAVIDCMGGCSRLVQAGRHLGFREVPAHFETLTVLRKFKECEMRPMTTAGGPLQFPIGRDTCAFGCLDIGV
jgi:hypothetical protein